MGYALRQFQSKAKRDVYEQRDYFRYKCPHQQPNILLVSPTGSGKTVIGGSMLADHDGPAVAIAHRRELVGQMSRALAENGVRHGIVAPDPIVRAIRKTHIDEFGYSFIDQNGHVRVAGIDTLINIPPTDPWPRTVTMRLDDEAHHVQQDNKWGRGVLLFPNAWGVGLTAAAIRGDGGGLGRHASGVYDAMVEAPRMRELIKLGYLTDYKLVVAKTDDLDLSGVEMGKEDYNQVQVRKAVHKSNQIVGDVVKAYLKYASGKLGVTFAVDIEAAVEIASAYRAAGVKAEVISSKTPDELRVELLRRFKNREILQLVNVDLFGEGFDLPAIEVVSMARPTKSFQLFTQQFGRALRLMISKFLAGAWDTYTPEQRKQHIAESGKPFAFIIDHVGNCLGNHGLPDRESIVFTLDDRVKAGGQTDAIPLRGCGNKEIGYVTTFMARDRKISFTKALEVAGSVHEAIARGWIDPEPQFCSQPYERFRPRCPHCGWVPEPIERARPEQVDGEMILVDPALLEQYRKDIAKIDQAPAIPQNLPQYAVANLRNVHAEVRTAQYQLRHAMGLWGGARGTFEGMDTPEQQKAFYLTFGIDVLAAQTLRLKEATALRERIENALLVDNVTTSTLHSPQP